MIGQVLQADCSAVTGFTADLIYADPPWCTGQIFRCGDEVAYDDRFRDRCAETEYRLRALLMALHVGVGHVLWNYAMHVVPRLWHAYRSVLSPVGTMYIHLDPSVAWLVRPAFELFRARPFLVSEVIWRYRRWPAKSRAFQSMHDTILVYTKGEIYTWNQLHEPLSGSTLKTFGGRKQRADFSSGRRKPGVVEESSPGAPLSDVWEIPIVAPSGKERARGGRYPTQKPEALLERIILASSNERDLVFDPFCGSGTTLAVAERLRRRWIGCDTSPVACRVSRERLGLADV